MPVEDKYFSLVLYSHKNVILHNIFVFDTLSFSPVLIYWIHSYLKCLSCSIILKAQLEPKRQYFQEDKGLETRCQYFQQGEVFTKVFGITNIEGYNSSLGFIDMVGSDRLLSDLIIVGCTCTYIYRHVTEMDQLFIKYNVYDWLVNFRFHYINQYVLKL